jgi:hypothetical protein
MTVVVIDVGWRAFTLVVLTIVVLIAHWWGDES